MRILIIYATNSGGTYFAAQIIENFFEAKNYSVSVSKANEVVATNINAADLVILGSCTWEVDGEEGQMHPWFFDLKKNLADKKFPGKPFAVFGLGDSSYITFCQATDHLEKLVAKLGGKRVVTSLRINRFYADEDKKTEFVVSWTQQIDDVIEPAKRSVTTTR